MQSFIGNLLAKKGIEAERRQHDRISWMTGAMLEFPDGDEAHKTGDLLQIVTVDVSLSGFGCISPDAIADGTRLAVHFVDVPEQPVVSGVARHCKTVTNAVAPYYRIGIEFDEPFEEAPNSC